MNESYRVRNHCVRTLQDCATWETKTQYQKIKWRSLAPFRTWFERKEKTKQKRTIEM